MIAVLVIGSIATLAVASATMSSYKVSNRSYRSNMLDREYYPRDSLFPEDQQTQWDRDSVYFTPRSSLRDSLRRSTIGGKRKSMKKI